MRTAPYYAVLVTALACEGPPRVDAPVPAEVRWVALLERGGDGANDRTSALARWDGESLPLIAREERTLSLLGYADAQVLGALAPGTTPDVLASEPLRVAGVCEAALPPPRFAGRWTGGATLEPDVEAAGLRMTASWAVSSCPDALELTVDVDCRDHRCPISLARSGCELTADLASCGLGIGTGAIDRGELCLAFPARGCEPIPDAEAALAQRCDGPAESCALRWFVRREPEAVRVARVDLRLGPTFRPRGAELGGPLDPLLLRTGYAWAIAPVGDGALVSSPASGAREDCDPSEPGRLSLTDGALVTGTASAPPCLLELEVESASTALGVFANGGAWTLGRFDAHGRAIGAARPIMDVAIGRRPDTAEWRPIALLRAPAGWVLGLRQRSGAGTVLYAFDAALELRDRRDLGAVDLTALAIHGDGLIATARGSSRLILASVAAGVEREVALRGAGPIYAPARLGELTVAGDGAPSALQLFDGVSASLAVIFDDDTTPTLAAALPWRDDRALVFGLRADRTSTRSLLSRSSRRFLPATTPLSGGPITRAVPDRARRVWALSPWTGEVLVFEPPT